MPEQNCWPWRRSPIVAVPREWSAMCVVDTHEVRSSSAHFAAGHNQTSEWPSIRVPVNIAANGLAIFRNTRKRNDVEVRRGENEHRKEQNNDPEHDCDVFDGAGHSGNCMRDTA